MPLKKRINILSLLPLLCPFKGQHSQVLHHPPRLFSLWACSLRTVFSHGLTATLHALSPTSQWFCAPSMLRQLTFLTASWVPPGLVSCALSCHATVHCTCALPTSSAAPGGGRSSHNWFWPMECEQRSLVSLRRGHLLPGDTTRSCSHLLH